MKVETELRYVGFDLEDVAAQANLLAKPKVIKFKRAVFDIPTKEGWLRLRTDGVLTTLTVKIKSSERVSESFESELEVKGFDETIGVLKALNYIPRSVQTNYRVLFLIQNCEFTIDLWPGIAPLVEIEGENEAQISEVAALFPGLGRYQTDKTVSELYEDAGIDVKHVKDLDFIATPAIIEELIT